MVGHFAAVIAAVEPHFRHRSHVSTRPQRADLLQADDLGPEPVRFLNVADVQHDVVHPDRGYVLLAHGILSLF